MTQIREANFAVDLPGEWERADNSEPGTFEYRESGGTSRLLVTLLAVRPMFAIADQRRLLEDYMSHRTKYEKGQSPYLENAEPFLSGPLEPLSGGWAAAHLDTGARLAHHVLLTGGLLADFAFEASDVSDDEFGERAEVIFRSATVSLEPED